MSINPREHTNIYEPIYDCTNVGIFIVLFNLLAVVLKKWKIPKKKKKKN